MSSQLLQQSNGGPNFTSSVVAPNDLLVQGDFSVNGSVLGELALPGSAVNYAATDFPNTLTGAHQNIAGQDIWSYSCVDYFQGNSNPQVQLFNVTQPGFMEVLITQSGALPASGGIGGGHAYYETFSIQRNGDTNTLSLVGVSVPIGVNINITPTVTPTSIKYAYQIANNPTPNNLIMTRYVKWYPARTTIDNTL